MKHLNEFKIYESSNWWEEKLKDYELKHDYIKDILYDFFDEGEIRISADFKNRKFTMISKKTDALPSQFYISYTIIVYTSDFSNQSVENFIRNYKKLSQCLLALDSEFETKVSQNGSSIWIECLDINQPFNAKSIDYKGKKLNSIIRLQKHMADLLIEKLEKTKKIFDIRKISDYEVNISSKIDLEKSIYIIKKMFSKELEADKIEISNDYIKNKNIKWEYIKTYILDLI